VRTLVLIALQLINAQLPPAFLFFAQKEHSQPQTHNFALNVAQVRGVKIELLSKTALVVRIHSKGFLIVRLVHLVASVLQLKLDQSTAQMELILHPIRHLVLLVLKATSALLALLLASHHRPKLSAQPVGMLLEQETLSVLLALQATTVHPLEQLLQPHVLTELIV
jgi:hypothetical protein